MRSDHAVAEPHSFPLAVPWASYAVTDPDTAALADYDADAARAESNAGTKPIAYTYPERRHL